MAKSHMIAPPAGCTAALFFLDGQYVFSHDGDGAITSKFVSTAAVRQAFAGESIDSGWLPEGVIRWGAGSRGTWMVRWHEPGLYKVIIEGERPFRVALPSLLWFGQKTHYYIFAARAKTFSPKAELFRAPLPNVNSSGLI
ncbi:MAG: prokaryotic E2 ligase family D protein, partial [Blastocatellia bacterium]|nr:prokaryotic E2 ligase family D protein [Blastocatellia bacterium]